MKHYRIRVEVDITARHIEHAERLARLLCSDLEQRPCVRDVLPDGIEERQPVTPMKRG
jgi:hypothetical protein